MLGRKMRCREVLLIVVITACLLLLTGCGAKSETADPTEKPAVSDVGEPAQTEPQEQPGPALPEDGGTERGAENGACFTVSDTGTLISPDGTEYEFLANEGFLYYLGELEFVKERPQRTITWAVRFRPACSPSGTTRRIIC